MSQNFDLGPSFYSMKCRKWENRGSETFNAPPPSRQGQTFHAPPFKCWKFYSPPPLHYGFNFKLLRKNYPKTLCASSSAWLKLVLPSPLSQGRIQGGEGGSWGSGPPPPFRGTPKLHKGGKNVARMRANTPNFST